VQAAANIQKNTEISSEITLLSQRGSRVVAGGVQLIPVGESIVYVQPFFTIATNSPNPFPQFQFVATLVQGKSPTKALTVTDALAQLFGAPTTPTTPTTPDTPTTPPAPTDRSAAELLADAAERFAAAEEALRAGDLGRYQQLVGDAQDLVDLARDALGAGGGSGGTTTTTAPGTPLTSLPPSAQEASLPGG
jgi:uncharacterized membrane protein (UPF0182 family)